MNTNANHRGRSPHAEPETRSTYKQSYLGWAPRVTHRLWACTATLTVCNVNTGWHTSDWGNIHFLLPFTIYVHRSLGGCSHLPLSNFRLLSYLCRCVSVTLLYGADLGICTWANTNKPLNRNRFSYLWRLRLQRWTGSPRQCLSRRRTSHRGLAGCYESSDPLIYSGKGYYWEKHSGVNKM